MGALGARIAACGARRAWLVATQKTRPGYIHSSVVEGNGRIGYYPNKSAPIFAETPPVWNVCKQKEAHTKYHWTGAILPFFLYHLTAGFNPSSRRSLHDGIVKLHRSIASAPIPIHWLFIGGLAEHRCESSFVPSSRQSSRETLALCPSNFGAEPIKTPRSSLCRRCSSMF